ncbi:YciI family protein [Salinispora tropica]|uniref:DGPFAETKE family protein n=1 Tax=Salinispora tropica (strain ATCC BAA-916 / DSM 44818 / JCM 13857 / NBRC 105044 / CNB-440) TaxID=369723 RepID=A4X8G3_SALTO|nr:YciI family protein [Salinispora tropica]ABP55163.1 DGPFAETKE family protein [Salinispora tropica CNB-440]
MKFLLLHMNPSAWEALTNDDQNSAIQGHDEFIKLTRESGEFVATKAVGDPSTSSTVRVRDGKSTVTDGTYLPTTAGFMCGYYVVDVASKERALELAAQIPEAKYTGVEVRPVAFEAGAE